MDMSKESGGQRSRSFDLPVVSLAEAELLSLVLPDLLTLPIIVIRQFYRRLHGYAKIPILSLVQKFLYDIS